METTNNLNPKTLESSLQHIIASSNDRFGIWTQFINSNNLKTVAEIGVYRGVFAETMLVQCPGIHTYYMIDPWRNLADWNKPSNKDNQTFEGFYHETLQRTNFAQERRVVLRGKTTEVLDKIRDGELDFAYVDGDHTFKGITIDLLNCWSKVKLGGFIGGDDFTKSIWRHKLKFEPSGVFPFAVYFAEAVGTKVYALPYSQFLIEKSTTGHEFIDFTGNYRDTTLLYQFKTARSVRIKKNLKKKFSTAYKLFKFDFSIFKKHK